MISKGSFDAAKCDDDCQLYTIRLSSAFARRIGHVLKFVGPRAWGGGRGESRSSRVELQWLKLKLAYVREVGASDGVLPVSV